MRKAKKGIQVGLFEQEMFQPVDRVKEVEEERQREPERKQEEKVKHEPIHGPRILIGSTRSCPVCGEDIKLHPDGTMRCTKCQWWQGIAE